MVLKLGQNFESISMGLLKPKTLEGNRFMRSVIVRMTSPQ